MKKLITEQNNSNKKKKKNQMRTLTTFLTILLLFTTVVASFIFVSADEVEPLSHKSFSLYDFVGGLWQVSNLQSSFDADASFASRMADAISPDFITSCTVEGNPGFPTQIEAKIRMLGLPASVQSSLGSGSSQALHCSLQVNEKGYSTKNAETVPLIPKKIADTFNTIGYQDTKLLIVPTSMNAADLYQLVPLNSILDEEEKKYYTETLHKKKIDGLNEDHRSKAQVVTHTGKLEMKHQFKTLNANQPGVKDLLASLPQRAKHGFAAGSSILVPVYRTAKNANNTACKMQITRVSAVVTTNSDALITTTIRYQDHTNTDKEESCFAVSEAATASVTSQDDDGAETLSAGNKNQLAPEPKKEHLFFFTAKRFARVYDEEVTDPDLPWYSKSKFGPSIGAVALLIVIIGGRKATSWYFKRKGIDVNQFLKSTKGKTKEEIMQMRKLKQSIKTGPTTDEEVAKLQALEHEQEVARMNAANQPVEEEDPYEGM